MSVRITNQGLDLVTSVDSNDSTGIMYFEKWHRYTAIGTGSTAPAQTDIGLEAEVARTSSTGGFSGTDTEELDATANKARYVTTTYRVFNFTSSYNLTEYGHFTGSSGSNAVFRDLFRQDPNDPNSAAITISVQDGDQLQIIKTFILEVAWEAASKTVDVTGIGNITGTQVLGVQSASWLKNLLRTLWPGENPAYLKVFALDETVPTDRGAQLPGSALSSQKSCTQDDYTSGTYTRRRKAKFETSDANHDWYGWCAGGFNSTNAQYASLRFVTDTQPAFTKADTHTLELWLDVSWARG